MQNFTHWLDTFDDHNFSAYKLAVITIYDSPDDVPGKYVARIWDLDRHTIYAIKKDTLAEIREVIPKQFACIGRMSEDDPQIVEVYV